MSNYTKDTPRIHPGHTVGVYPQPLSLKTSGKGRESRNVEQLHFGLLYLLPFTQFTACSKGIGHKGKARGVQPPKSCPPKTFTALGSLGASWGHGDSPSHSSSRLVLLCLRDKTDVGHTNQITTDRG